MTPVLIRRMSMHLNEAVKSISNISEILPGVEDPDAEEFQGELFDVCGAMASLEELRKKLKERLEK